MPNPTEAETETVSVSVSVQLAPKLKLELKPKLKPKLFAVLGVAALGCRGEGVVPGTPHGADLQAGPAAEAAGL